MKKFIQAHVKKVNKEKGMLLNVVGSTGDIDRYGEIVDQESWDLKNFKKNPVILWAHNLSFGEDRPPIGKATKVKVVEGKLTFDIQFDMADPFAADIFRKYAEGFLNTFSVGFIPKKVEWQDDEKKPNLRAILRDNELLELSAVPVPANPNALQELSLRSFRTKTWDTLMKEAEEVDPKDDDEKLSVEEEKETEVTEDDATNVEREETTETGEEEAEIKGTEEEVKEEAKKLSDTTKSITEVVIKAEEPKENSGGQDSSPKKTQQGSVSPKLVSLLRETTRNLQSVLREINAMR